MIRFAVFRGAACIIAALAALIAGRYLLSAALFAGGAALVAWGRYARR